MGVQVFNMEGYHFLIYGNIALIDYLSKLINYPNIYGIKFIIKTELTVISKHRRIFQG